MSLYAWAWENGWFLAPCPSHRLFTQLIREEVTTNECGKLDFPLCFRLVSLLTNKCK